MKMRNVLLGSAAALALGSNAYAADPVAVALDTCDLLGTTGLTISSETNCLKFEGEISYEWKWGNHDVDSDDTGPQSTFNDIEWFVKATATSDSDFGPAMAALKLNEKDDNPAQSDGVLNVDEVYVGIGDANATVFYAGKKGSVTKLDDDKTFTKIFSLDKDGEDGGLALSDKVKTGGYVLQASTNLGNGVNAALGLENLETSGGLTGDKPHGGSSLVTAVGVKQDWGTAHATYILDDQTDDDGAVVAAWAFHAGATINVDQFKFRAAHAVSEVKDSWKTLLTAQGTFDMFTLAAGVELSADDEYEAAFSGETKVSQDVTLTAAYRVAGQTNKAPTEWDFAVKGALKITDTLTASAKVNFDEVKTAFETDLDWAPGGGTTVNVGLNIDSKNNTSASAKFKKKFN